MKGRGKRVISEGVYSTPESRRANVLSLSRHVPSRARGATQRVAPDEPRKRRAGERHVVGCCEELGRSRHQDNLSRFHASYCLSQLLDVSADAFKTCISRVDNDDTDRQPLKICWYLMRWSIVTSTSNSRTATASS